MADDATPIIDPARTAPLLTEAHRAALRGWVEREYYESEQDALDHAIELLLEFRVKWERDLVPFLEERLRQGREDLANGLCRPADEVFAELIARAEARVRGELVD